MFGRGNTDRLRDLREQVDAADTGDNPMPVKDWDRLHGRYVRTSDDAARHMETVKIRQWKR